MIERFNQIARSGLAGNSRSCMRTVRAIRIDAKRGMISLLSTLHMGVAKAPLCNYMKNHVRK